MDEPVDPVFDMFTYEVEDLRRWCSVGLNLRDECHTIKERFGRIKGIRILEAAAGKAEHAVLLRHYGFDVTTLDIDPKNNPDLLHDLHKPIPRRTGAFHVVTSHHTLEHLEIGYLPTILKEFHRVLRPNGVLFVTLPVRSRPFVITLRFARWFFATKVRRQLKDYTPHAIHHWELSKNWMKPKDFPAELERVGFSKIEQYESHYNPFEIRYVAFKEKTSETT